MKEFSFPSEEMLETAFARTPKYMYPNKIPQAVVFEGILSDDLCDEMIADVLQEEPYKFDHCGAETREVLAPFPSSLDALLMLTLRTNIENWNYIVDPGGVAWMQTYEVDGDYQLHTDSFPGQMRKLTAVAMLSDPHDYVGGELQIQAYPLTYHIPRTRGTVVVFLPWLPHEVTKVHSGVRRTINLGLWGPPFR